MCFSLYKQAAWSFAVDPAHTNRYSFYIKSTTAPGRVLAPIPTQRLIGTQAPPGTTKTNTRIVVVVVAAVIVVVVAAAFINVLTHCQTLF